MIHFGLGTEFVIKIRISLSLQIYSLSRFFSGIGGKQADVSDGKLLSPLMDTRIAGGVARVVGVCGPGIFTHSMKHNAIAVSY